MVVTKKKGVVNSAVEGHDVSTNSRKPSQSGGSGNNKNGAQACTSPLGRLDPNVDAIVPCRVCDKNVGRGESLQYDRCKSWLHLRCAKMSREDYDFLTMHPKTSVHWHCEPCKSDILSGPDGQDDRVAQQGAKIDTLTEVVKTMQNQMAVML